MFNKLIKLGSVIFSGFLILGATMLVAETPPEATSSAPRLGLATFNPAVSVILSGQYGYFSEEATNIPGFQIGCHGARSGEGLKLGESEINFSANIDHVMRGVLTLGIGNDHGHDKLKVEEAFIESLSLPYGLTIKAGRFFPSFGYLNDKHKHTDSFSDRPLPYRAYLNGGFFDDGVQASVVLPTGLFSEIGAGVFNGSGFPASEDHHSPALTTAFARIGGDFNTSHAWLLGASYMRANNDEVGRVADGFIFHGSNNIYGVDFRYIFAPQGNNKTSEFSLQAEVLHRSEDGEYKSSEGCSSNDHHHLTAFHSAHTEGGEGHVHSSTTGFYAQGVYKFMQNYRIGYRFALLTAPKTPEGLENTSLDAGGHNPRMHSIMAEYNTSEFGTFRLQYNFDQTHGCSSDNQIVLSYSVSFGAHPAHAF